MGNIIETTLRSSKMNFKPRWSINPKEWNYYMDCFYDDTFDIHMLYSGILDNIEVEEELYCSGLDSQIYDAFCSGGIYF